MLLCVAMLWGHCSTGDNNLFCFYKSEPGRWHNNLPNKLIKNNLLKVQCYEIYVPSVKKGPERWFLH